MKMRKRFSLLAAAAIALSVVAGGCAKEKAPSQPEPPNKEAVGKEKKAAPKAGLKWFTGTIETLDAASGTLTLKGPKGTMEFKADGSAKKDLDGMDIGDKVIVKHTGEIAHSIVKPGAINNPRARKEKEESRKAVDLVPKAE